MQAPDDLIKLNNFLFTIVSIIIVFVHFCIIRFAYTKSSKDDSFFNLSHFPKINEHEIK